MVPDGSTRRPDSSCPFKHSARCSAASSARNFVDCSNRTDSSSITPFSSLHHLEHSTISSGNSAKRTGSYTLSHPSAVPNTFSTIWRATPIASPSLTIVSWPLRTITCHSAGETMPTAARRRLWPFPQMSSCADSFFTSCLKVWSASATSACSPTEEGKPPSHVAASCLTRRPAQSAPKQRICRVAPPVQEPCWSSNGSPVLNFTFSLTYAFPLHGGASLTAHKTAMAHDESTPVAPWHARARKAT